MLVKAVELETPVVLFIFNRPTLTRKVMASLKLIQPKTLFIVADGPQTTVQEDAQNCREARKICEKPDWDCNIFTKYSDVNLGCFRNVAQGLDWVFSITEEAIILEDDCIPDPTFFPYCQELLSRYKNNTNVGVISGNNFQQGIKRGNDSYYFSIFNHLWGWATWKRAWNLFDGEMTEWKQGKDKIWINKLWDKHPSGAKYWSNRFNEVAYHRIDSWGYRWTYTCWKNNLLTAIPQVNLVTNIGFGPTSTHTKNKNDISANLKIYPMKFPLTHPAVILQNREADVYTQKTIFSPSLLRRVYQTLIKLFKMN